MHVPLGPCGAAAHLLRAHARVAAHTGRLWSTARTGLPAHRARTGAWAAPDALCGPLRCAGRAAFSMDAPRRAASDPKRDVVVNGATDVRNAVTKGTVGPSVDRVGEAAEHDVRPGAEQHVPPVPPPPSTGKRVAEDLLTVPNVLTMSRIALCPVIGWAVLTHRPVWAVGLLTVAASTDLLDGWIARRWKSYTVFGSIADPAADKLLMATMVVALTASGQMPWPLAAVILGRDVYLMLLAFYMRYRSLPKPRTWARYWDPRYPSVQVSPTRLSKYNTFLQLVLVAVLTVYPCLPEAYQIHPHVTRTRDALEWVVAGTTVYTGLTYAFTRRAVRYLHVK